MARIVLAFALLAGSLGSGAFAQSPLAGSTPAAPTAGEITLEGTDPLATDGMADSALSQASPTPTTYYTPGEGMTVSMLNGESKLKLFGSFSTIAAAATTRAFPTGGPLFLLPPSAVNPTNTFDIGARQSSFGASFSGPEICGFTPGAFLLAYIQNDNLTSDAYGFLPYNAWGELKNDTWRFAAGLQPDVFNPAAPTMIALIGIFDSGNCGSFRGQIRAEHFYKPYDDFQLTTQVALSEPVSTIVTDNRRIIEDNGWPNVEGRLAAGLGEIREMCGGRKLRPITFGVSGVIGQMRNATLQAVEDVPPALIRSTLTVWGLGSDLQVAITDRFGFTGEVFLGQSLGEYNAMIGQSFSSDNLGPVRGAGGFGELYFYLNDKAHLHTGYGVDAPVRTDLGATDISHNQTYYANIFWDISKTYQWSFQVEHRETDFVTFRQGKGEIFMTQFLWRF
jgi:hypothetical protein